MEYTLHATTVVSAGAGEVFDLITDIERLPDWNIEIPKVVESPPGLDVGSEWVVTIHAMKTEKEHRWTSRSTSARARSGARPSSPVSAAPACRRPWTSHC